MVGQSLAVQLRDDVVSIGVLADGTHDEAFMTEP